MNTTETSTRKAPCGAEWHGLRAGLPDCGCGWGELCDSPVEKHRVYATDANGKTWRVSDDLTWNMAQEQWRRLDDCRTAKLMPHVRHFEVRSADDPQERFAKASVNMTLLRVVLNPKARGFRNEETAAREAWKAFAPTFRSWYDKRVAPDNPQRRTGVQGRGGWYFYPNGQTAAQGLTGLVPLARRMNLYVRGVDGRFYVLDLDLDRDGLTVKP